MLAWCDRVRRREIKEFDSFLTTVDDWLDEIMNYFLERQTSGFVEGFNNRIEVLKRCCYGIFNVKRIFQRLTLDVNGYELNCGNFILDLVTNSKLEDVNPA